MILDSEDHQAIAQNVVALLRAAPVPADPWLTQAQVLAHLNVSRASFFRLRAQHPTALKPCSEHPLRWSKNALDLFKVTRAAPVRRGRKRMEVAA